MRGRLPLIFLAVAVALAGLAAWGAQVWISSQAKQAAAVRVTLVPVVTSTTELAAGQRLEARHLETIKKPTKGLPKGYFSLVPQVVGRVLRVPLEKGETVLAQHLAPVGASGGLAAVVPDGYRAMTVKVDPVIGVGGFIQPGDRVDVFTTMAKGPFRENPITRMVLQNIKVLTVGAKTMQVPQKGGRATSEKVRVVTLQVKPEEAERLALSAEQGKLILALRSVKDRQDLSTPGIRMTSMMENRRGEGGPQAPLAVKPRVMLQKKTVEKGVEVIRGVERSMQNL